MVEKDTLPLIVTGLSGRVVTLSLMNRKAYTKSLEAGKLWHVHEDTDRVLPLDIPGTMLSLHDDRKWFNALVSEDSPESGRDNKAAPPAVPEVLEELAAVIAQRKKTLPEGSYTTHLFSSGPDKIKKKLGEEAVELILARDKNEIAGEGADLIYHLMVYLEEVGVPLSDVLQELRQRSRS